MDLIVNEVHFSSLIPRPDSVNPIADNPVSHCSFRKVSINDHVALRIKSVLSGIIDISIKERQASALLVKCSKKLNHDDVETAFWVEFGLSDHDKDLNKHQCLSLVNTGSTWKVELWESDIIVKNISSDECSTVLGKIILKSLPPSDGPDNCLHVLMDSFAIASENDGIRYLITANIKNCYGIILWDVTSKTGSMMHMVDDRVCNEVMRAT
ncbi:hypothetical protein [Endozoicomonas sp. SCSIO W0465]|uniref:hypothetical protein n=1 Tax=Endozoicomonas sp. SCSIO W0465 TaxID=2918516 RepID=UPI0020762D62|nr:hypothetical protein [Endozoicomonas sp. SCSIO W0465]USE38557.1 hypothetical protein MJO57_10510 [Endozoicomonas sp. SCSIO W0465]